MSNTFKPLKKGKTIFLFDIDGTLTPARLTIKENMVECLKNLKQKENVTIATIGGSDVKKAQEQLQSHLSLFKYVFTENGLVSFDENGKIFHSQKISTYIGEEGLKSVINFCLRYIADLDIPIKRGTFVEFRTGLINVSPIGRNCSQEERVAFNKYNKEHKILEKMKDEVEKNFGKKLGLKVVVGGEISMDIFPIGWGKEYCLQFVKDYDNIVFLGDKTFPGGNDHDIATSDKITRAYQTQNPEDTIVKLNEIMKELESL